MDARTKREIKLLVGGFADPRRGFGRTITPFSIYYGLLRNSTYGAEGGALFMVLLLGPIFIPLGFVLFWIFGPFGAVAAVVAALVVMGVVALIESADARRTQKLCNTHEHMLCVWCTRPIVHVPERGVCATCGKGYDARASWALWRDLRHAMRPDRKTQKRRVTRAWARAVRERDHAQP